MFFDWMNKNSCRTFLIFSIGGLIGGAIIVGLVAWMFASLQPVLQLAAM